MKKSELEATIEALMQEIAEKDGELIKSNHRNLDLQNICDDLDKENAELKAKIIMYQRSEVIGDDR